MENEPPRLNITKKGKTVQFQPSNLRIPLLPRMPQTLNRKNLHILRIRRIQTKHVKYPIQKISPSTIRDPYNKNSFHPNNPTTKMEMQRSKHRPLFRPKKQYPKFQQKHRRLPIPKPSPLPKRKLPKTKRPKQYKQQRIPTTTKKKIRTKTRLPFQKNSQTVRSHLLPLPTRTSRLDPKTSPTKKRYHKPLLYTITHLPLLKIPNLATTRIQKPMQKSPLRFPKRTPRKTIISRR